MDRDEAIALLVKFVRSEIDEAYDTWAGPEDKPSGFDGSFAQLEDAVLVLEGN